VIILDTNVFSEFTRPKPSEQVQAWFASQIPADLATTAVTEGELYYGVHLFPEGARKIETARAYDALLALLGGGIHAFDSEAARAFASISAQRKRAGLEPDIADCQIAAIAQVLGASVATRNVADFTHAGIEIINPWTA
jgi:predicted nucleic acid-binding protein